jgi:NadR type nicotinamide-nucleotide adenylyltransferase
MAKNNAKPIKVVITGPESAGKSTLSEQLANHFQVNYVPEYAREYLELTRGKYGKNDLIKIAKEQIKLENKYAQQNPELLICDTSLEVIRVWSEWKYGDCHEFILRQAKKRAPDLFLLLKPDLPWQSDPLRENPDNREEIYQYYQKLLVEYQTTIAEIRGDKNQRCQSAIEIIKQFLC